MKIETISIITEIKAAKLEVGDLICLLARNKRKYYAVVLEPKCNDFNNPQEHEPIAKVRQLSNGYVFTWYQDMFTKYEFVTHLDGYVVE